MEKSFKSLFCFLDSYVPKLSGLSGFKHKSSLLSSAFMLTLDFFYFFIFIFKLTVAKCISKRITFQNKHSKLSSVKHYFGQRIMEKLVTDPIFT